MNLNYNRTAEYYYLKPLDTTIHHMLPSDTCKCWCHTGANTCVCKCDDWSVQDRDRNRQVIGKGAAALRRICEVMDITLCACGNPIVGNHPQCHICWRDISVICGYCGVNRHLPAYDRCKACWFDI